MSSAKATDETVTGNGPWGRFKDLKEQHHIAFEVSFFFAGFLFDVPALAPHRLEPLLIHQGTYLVLLGAADRSSTTASPCAARSRRASWGKMAGYRLWVMHFFLGTLLNAFMVFYFRSLSGCVRRASSSRCWRW